MPYIYEDAELLEGKPPVGTKQCVALVKEYAKVPASSLWREGDTVRKNFLLKKGTAIATFVGGKYPNRSSGNHAALYIGQDVQGIWVIDQWTKGVAIQKRRLAFKGKDKDGNYVDPSNNGDAFSVIR